MTTPPPSTPSLASQLSSSIANTSEPIPPPPPHPPLSPPHTPLNSYNSQTLLTLQNLTPAQIPASMLQHTVRPPTRCDIFQRKSSDELKFFRDFYFVKFVELLNKLTRVDDKRTYSKSALAYMEANNIVPHPNESLSPYAIMSCSSTTTTTTNANINTNNNQQQQLGVR